MLNSDGTAVAPCILLRYITLVAALESRQSSKTPKEQLHQSGDKDVCTVSNSGSGSYTTATVAVVVEKQVSQNTGLMEGMPKDPVVGEYKCLYTVVASSAGVDNDQDDDDPDHADNTEDDFSVVDTNSC